jgi:hypothetical protein
VLRVNLGSKKKAKGKLKVFKMEENENTACQKLWDVTLQREIQSTKYLYSRKEMSQITYPCPARIIMKR